MDPIYALGRILDPIYALGRILDPISPPCSTVTLVNVQIDFYYVISARLYNNDFCEENNEEEDYNDCGLSAIDLRDLAQLAEQVAREATRGREN